jgi:PEGA domain-containing protein
MSLAKMYVLVIVLVSLCAVTGSQVASTAEMRESSGQKMLYKRTAGEIARANPAVSKETLQLDLAVVQNAEPRLREHYPNTFTDSDVWHIAADAWVGFREKQPKEQLDVDKFAKLASESYGGLKITSKPDGAAIEVDSKRWDDPTNARGSCHTGTRLIKLSKSGYQTVAGNAVVTEGKWTLFHRDLKAK